MRPGTTKFPLFAGFLAMAHCAPFCAPYRAHPTQPYQCASASMQTGLQGATGHVLPRNPHNPVQGMALRGAPASRFLRIPPTIFLKGSSMDLLLALVVVLVLIAVLGGIFVHPLFLLVLIFAVLVLVMMSRRNRTLP